MRRISAIVLFAIALFLGSLTFASAATSPDVAANGSTDSSTTSDTSSTTPAASTLNVAGVTAGVTTGSNTGSGAGQNADHTSGDPGSSQAVSSSSPGGLSLTSLSDQYKQIDMAPKGDSIGDEFVFSDRLYVGSGSHQDGTLDGVCVLTRVDKDKKAINQQCVVTVSLSGGQLTAQGMMRFSAATAHATFPMAITGGTGDYDSASGVAHVTFVSNTKTKVEVDLNH